MMKKLILLTLITILIPICYGLEECGKVIEPTDIPCQVTSLWNYSNCPIYNATVYNQSGTNIINYSFLDLDSTGLCHFAWNVSTVGSYIYIVENGDSGNITVEADNMMLGLIIGIGIIVAAFLWLAFSLESEHFLLKVLLIFTSISLLSLIPATIILTDTSVILHKAYLTFKWTFWLYVITYFIYKILTKMGLVVPKEGGYDG